MNADAIPEIVLASRNHKKVAEIRELFVPFGIATVGIADFPDVPDVVEDGKRSRRMRQRRRARSQSHSNGGRSAKTAV